jgi:hypothetical protein
MKQPLTPCQHRHRFVLVDLFGQLDAVNRYVRGWSVQSIAEWLWLYGEIRGIFYPGFYMDQFIDETDELYQRVLPSDIKHDLQYRFVPHQRLHDIYVYPFRITAKGRIEIGTESKRVMMIRAKLGQ